VGVNEQDLVLTLSGISVFRFHPLEIPCSVQLKREKCLTSEGWKRMRENHWDDESAVTVTREGGGRLIYCKYLAASHW